MTIDTYVFPFSSINDNDDVFRKDTRIIDIPDVSEQECSMSNTFQQFAYSDHGVCDYDRLIDPVNNLYNNILVNCKYYDNFQFNVLSKKENTGLSIIHFNARSLNANFDHIKDCLCTLNIPFDVITISETWVEVEKTTDYEMLQYQAFHKVRSHKKGGGVAIYVNNRFDCTIVESKSMCIENNFECLTVELNMPKMKNVIISCVYRTPGARLDTFCESLETIISGMNVNKAIYICGDFNIDLLKNNIHTSTKNVLDMMYSLGMYPLISKPTRVTSMSATLIDNIFTNEMKYQVNSGVLISDISDHLPVFAICYYDYLIRGSRSHQFKRILNNDAVEKLKIDLNQQTWQNVFDQSDVNLAYNIFIRDFQCLLNKHCPLKCIAVVAKTGNKPWFTNGLKKACRKKTRLYKIFLSQRTLASEIRYKTYKNRLTTILRASKKEHYCKLLEEQRYNITETWKILRNVMGNNLQKSNYPGHFVSEGKRVGDKNEIAKLFNNFFTNIGPDLAKQITVPDDVSVLDYLTNKNLKSMFLSPTDDSEVIRVVHNFKNKTSVDSDGLSMKFVKSIIQCIVKPISHICNSSLLSGVFPDKMKIAKIIPLFKSGSKNEFNNYRPISLLPQLSKILEKLFNNRLNKFVTNSKILNSCQYGFREGISTSHALVELVNEITNSLNKKKHSIGVFIDLRKAFDTVDHRLLCKKLEFYGIRGIAQDWITSYLSNRTQHVSYDGHASDNLEITCGVPQGSILGPRLFILYVNDMCNVSKLLKFILFADDTNIFYSHDRLPELVNVLNTELDNMYTWFCVNKLSLNVAKTNYILFGNYRHEQHVALRIKDINIERVEATKFLGVIIDESLSWNNHINSVKSKLAKVSSVIYKVSHCIDRSSMHTLYCSLFLPYIMYCSEIWGNTHKTKLHGIIMLQKRVMRTVYGVDRLEHTNYLF